MKTETTALNHKASSLERRCSKEGGLHVPQNELQIICSVMNVFKEKREVISVNHCNKGSKSSPSFTACKLVSLL